MGELTQARATSWWTVKSPAFPLAACLIVFNNIQLFSRMYLKNNKKPEIQAKTIKIFYFCNFFIILNLY